MKACGRILAVLVALTLLAAGPALAQGKRVALVLGIGAYQNAAPLANPANDARAIAGALGSAGFELVGGGPQLDLDRPGLEKAIRAFGNALVGADVGLFFYAGHGIQMQGANYLVPVAANVAREADVRYELVDVNLVIEEMTLADSRLNIVILDACRNNPFGGRGLRSATSGLAQMQAPAGTIIAYATQPGAVAADGAGSNSPYTDALSKAVLNPGETVFDVFNDVGVAVKRNTGGAQQPWVSSSPIEGRFYFLGPTTVTPPASAADKEVVFWDSVKDSRNPRMVEAYLKQFPQGTFAALAEARLAELAAAPAAPPTPRAEGPAMPAPVAMAAPPAAPIRLFDAAAVPYVSPKARETLGRFAALPSPKALAISPKGNYAYVSNSTRTRTAEDVRRGALQHCQLNAGGPCTLYAVDDAVVLESPAAFTPMPVAIPGGGLFDPATVPFVSDRTREVGMVKYQRNPGHKAVALTPTGRWTAVWSRASADEARDDALERCEEQSGKSTCYIYAVNDAVVFDEER